MISSTPTPWCLVPVRSSRWLDPCELQEFLDPGERHLPFDNLFFVLSWFIIRKSYLASLFVIATKPMPALSEASLLMPGNKRLESYNSQMMFFVKFSHQLISVLPFFRGMRRISWRIDCKEPLNLNESVTKFFTSVRKSFALLSANRKPMINQKTTKPEGHSDERNFPCRKSDIVERKFWFLLKLLIFCYWRLLNNW